MKTLNQLVRPHVSGQVSRIQIGRSLNVARFGSRTPVEVVPNSSAPPKLCGQPYLKTRFQNGNNFIKVLYTPSTLHVVVGAEWVAQQMQQEQQ
jgi:hypothetical protein